MIKPCTKSIYANETVTGPRFNFYQYKVGDTYHNDGMIVDFVTDGNDLYVCAIDEVTVTAPNIKDQPNLIKLISKGVDGQRGPQGAQGRPGHSPKITAKFDGKQMVIYADGNRIAVTNDLTGPSWKPERQGNTIVWNRTKDDEQPAAIDLKELRAEDYKPVLFRVDSDNTKRSDEESGPARFIQWKYEGEENWTNLISIAELMNLTLAGVSTWRSELDGEWHLGHREVLRAKYESTATGKKIISHVELGEVLFDAGPILPDFEQTIALLEARMDGLEDELQALRLEIPTKVSDFENDVPYLTEAKAADTYQPKGNYLEGPLKTINNESLLGNGDLALVKGVQVNDENPVYPNPTNGIVKLDLSDYAKKSDIPDETSLDGYATEDWVENGYQPKGDYVEGVRVNNGNVERPINGVVDITVPDAYTKGETDDAFIKKSDLKLEVRHEENGRYLYLSVDNGQTWTKIMDATCVCSGSTNFFTVTFGTPNPANAVVKVGDEVKHPGDTMQVSSGDSVCVTATASGYENFSKCYTIDSDTTIVPQLTPIVETTLSISPENLGFTAEGGSEQITVTTNADDYSVSESCDWLTVSKSGNTVQISASANNGLNRSCEVTFSAGDKTVILNVVQSAPEVVEYNVTIGNTCDADNAYLTQINGGPVGEQSLRVNAGETVYFYATKEGKKSISKHQIINSNYEFSINCSEWEDVEPEYKPVTDVAITNKPANNTVTWDCSDTQTIDLGVTVSPSDATNHDQIEWTSSNEDVALINSSTGRIRIIGAGTSTISALGSDNKSDSFTLTVNRPEVSEITLNKSNATLYVNGTETLTATLSPACAVGNVTWTTSNSSVATVSNGVVTGKSTGTAIITVTCDGKSATCNVTVQEVTVDVSGISLNSNSLNLTYGECDSEFFGDRTGFITATITPSDASNKNVNWSIADSTVASVSPSSTNSGSPVTIMAKNVGTTTLTARSDADSSILAECTITVESYDFTPETLVLDPASKQLDLNGDRTVQLTPVATPSCVDVSSITWTSEDTSVATVNASGLVTAVAEGETQIIAMVKGRQAQCVINVVNTYQNCEITSITIDPQSLDLDINETGTINANLTIFGGCTDTDKTITWTSSNSNIASVAKSGETSAIVTGVGTGTATITATTTNNKSQNCTVTVNDPTVYVQGVNIDECFSALKVGDTRIIHATISPSNAYETGVTYSSSNPNVITVNSSTGVINCVAAGTAVITATSVGTNSAKQNVTDQCFITVGENYSISLSKTLFDFPVSTTTSTPVVVTAAGGNWSASESCDWITLSSTSGGTGDTEINITASPNETVYDRECIITFTCGDQTATFRATQSGAETDGAIDISSISCYESDNIVSSAGCNTTITVNANTPWKLKVTNNPAQPDGPTNYSMLGLDAAEQEEVNYPSGSHQVQLYIHSNSSLPTDTEQRTGTLTLYDSTGETMIAQVDIVQAGRTHTPASFKYEAVNFTNGAGGSYANKQNARIIITPGSKDATYTISADMVDSSGTSVRNYLSSKTVSLTGDSSEWMWGGPNGDKFYEVAEWESSYAGATSIDGGTVNSGYRFKVTITESGTKVVDNSKAYGVYPK